MEDGDIIFFCQAHSDGPLFYPVVTTISCGSHTLLDFYRRFDTSEVDTAIYNQRMLYIYKYIINNCIMLTILVATTIYIRIQFVIGTQKSIDFTKRFISRLSTFHSRKRNGYCNGIYSKKSAFVRRKVYRRGDKET